MSVQTAVLRPAGRSAGAAMLGLVVSLALFVVLFMAFLIAPLALFGVALVAYLVAHLVVRPRAARRPRSAPVVLTSAISNDFGAGAP